MTDNRMLMHGDPPEYWVPLSEYKSLTARLAAAEAAARILCDDLSQFTRVEWLLERWPWLAYEAKGERE